MQSTLRFHYQLINVHFELSLRASISAHWLHQLHLAALLSRRAHNSARLPVNWLGLWLQVYRQRYRLTASGPIRNPPYHQHSEYTTYNRIAECHGDRSSVEQTLRDYGIRANVMLRLKDVAWLANNTIKYTMPSSKH